MSTDASEKHRQTPLMRRQTGRDGLAAPPNRIADPPYTYLPFWVLGLNFG